MAEQYRDTNATPELRTGAAVATDTGMAGTITEVLPDFPDAEGGVRIAWDGGHTTVVPRRALSVERDRILVRTDVAAHTAETHTKKATETGRVGAESEDIVVPVIEERLSTDARWREAGSVTLHLRTEEMPETVAEYVTREELEIEEVAVGRLLAEGEMPTQREEGDVTIIPVVEERLVMVKQRVLAKEVRISKRSRTETREVTETVRRQRVEIEGGELADRVRVHGTDPADRRADAAGETAPPRS